MSYRSLCRSLDSIYKGFPAKSTKPSRADSSETRLSSVQTIQPTHTKPATDRENKVQTAKSQPVFIAASGAGHLLAAVGSRLINHHRSGSASAHEEILGWLVGRLGDGPFIR